MRSILPAAAAVVSLSTAAFAGNEQLPTNLPARPVVAQQVQPNGNEVEPTFGARIASVGSNTLPLVDKEALVGSPAHG